MRVNNPLWRWGKIILEYRGARVEHQNLDAELQRVCFYEKMQVTSEIEEQCVVKVTLFDKTNVLLSLKSYRLYYEAGDPKTWVWSESSFIHSHATLIDLDFIIIQGTICFNKPVDGQLYEERYIFTMVFKNIQGILAKILAEMDAEIALD